MILYLHGLNSAGTAGKALTLREALAPVPVISPTYPAHRPRQAVAQLSQLIRKQINQTTKLIIIGSSMGGFYGQYLARQFPVYHLMMINPALKPWEFLQQREGEHQNFVTGERYWLTAEDIQQSRDYEIKKVNDGLPTTLFLDRGDETIDYRVAADLYRDAGELLIFEGGDHRFQHMKEAIAHIQGAILPAVQRCETPPHRCRQPSQAY